MLCHGVNFFANLPWSALKYLSHFSSFCVDPVDHISPVEHIFKRRSGRLKRLLIPGSSNAANSSCTPVDFVGGRNTRRFVSDKGSIVIMQITVQYFFFVGVSILGLFRLNLISLFMWLAIIYCFNFICIFRDIIKPTSTTRI